MIYQLRHPIGVVSIAVALVVGLLLHDAAQTLVAQLLGDPSARRGGRLRAGLQPRLDVYGAVAGVIVGYGWVSAVPMDERWRARRRRVALAASVGPLVYLALAFAAVAWVNTTDGNPLSQQARFSYLLAYTFAAMFVLSLVPTPPLDGGRIMFALAPQSPGWQRARYQLIDRGFGVAIALAIVFLPLAFRVPSIVGDLSADVLDGIGSAFGISHLGDFADVLNVP